jgi:hypothetical protein
MHLRQFSNSLTLNPYKSCGFTTILKVHYCRFFCNDSKYLPDYTAPLRRILQLHSITLSSVSNRKAFSSSSSVNISPAVLSDVPNICPDSPRCTENNIISSVKWAFVQTFFPVNWTFYQSSSKSSKYLVTRPQPSAWIWTRKQYPKRGRHSVRCTVFLLTGHSGLGCAPLRPTWPPAIIRYSEVLASYPVFVSTPGSQYLVV